MSVFRSKGALLTLKYFNLRAGHCLSTLPGFFVGDGQVKYDRIAKWHAIVKLQSGKAISPQKSVGFAAQPVAVIFKGNVCHYLAVQETAQCGHQYAAQHTE